MSKYGVFSGPYFPVFNPNTAKYGTEKFSYLDTFHVVPWIFSGVISGQRILQFDWFKTFLSKTILKL